jgi:hypothetical protein
MRKCKIDAASLKYRYTVHERPFWKALEKGLEAMFAPTAPDLDRIDPVTASQAATDPLSPSMRATVTDWAWYTPKRISCDNATDEYEDHYFEEELYRWLCEADGGAFKQIMLLHGRTGIGKTTFLRYFFGKYLRERDVKRAGKTYALRISVPVVAETKERAEDEFDHKVYQYLIETFRDGSFDLGNPANLIEMACIEFPRREQERKYFSEVQPPPASYPEQLVWVRKYVVGRGEEPESTTSASNWADFNRMAIRYLCSVDPELRFVFILDNVDHLMPSMQKCAWLLARHKLSWIKLSHRVFFIIAIRSYLLRNAEKESTIQAYTGKVQEIGLYPPSLYEVLHKRKVAYFDPCYPRRDPHSDAIVIVRLTHDGRTVPIYCANELLDSVLLAFKEREKDLFVAGLANFDLRQGMDMAKAVLQYPFYDWGSLAQIVERQYAAHAAEGGGLISEKRILDALVRRNNYLCEPSLSFFDNVFMVDESDHYANSLCKLFLLIMVEPMPCSLEKISSVLVKALGHPELMVKRAAATLLNCNIITSPQGVSIEGHNITELDSKETELCRRYLESLCCTLYYVQGMAYCTPMESKYATELPLPKMINEDDRIFADRVRAASILVQQVEADMSRQVDYVGQDNERIKAYHSYPFHEVVGRIKAGISRDLIAIQGAGAFPGAPWDELLALFR